MSEVDANVEMPNALPSQTLTNSSCSPAVAHEAALEDNNTSAVMVSSNGSHSEAVAKVENIVQLPVEAMDVDEDDAEAQAEVSSSTEVDQIVFKADAVVGDKKLAETTADDGIKAMQQDAKEQQNVEESSNRRDEENKLSVDKTAVKSNQPDTNAVDNDIIIETKSTNSKDNAEVETVAQSNKHNNATEETSKAVVSLANAKDTPIDSLKLNSSSSSTTAAAAQKENGVASKSERNELDTSIVDLGDDTDDEELEVPKKPELTITAVMSSNPAVQSNGKSVGMMLPINSMATGSDSDVALVIGSDSENEANVASSNANVQAKMQVQPIDDDDDDCVVIEDDTPALTVTTVSSLARNSEIAKRKAAADTLNSLDDAQPPIKRPCNISTVNSSSAVSGAHNNNKSRPLILQHPAKRTGDADIYPINITPAASNVALQTGPPKLVPMTMSNNATSNLFSSVSGLNMNANLLPGLTDDMFVLEAPSFIVPYIYEKPPSDNLKNIVKTIEDKFKLTKEDLADVDNSDEFDMMTEQNKEDKNDDKMSGGKKKKNRGQQNDGDDSWSEDSEENDDFDEDDDSDTEVRTKVLIKEANDDLTALKGAIKPAAALATSTANSATIAKPGMENYFESPLGKFFMDIGVGQVQEFVQHDLIRLQKRKMRKSLGKNTTEMERAITALSGNLEASKKKNAPFKFTMKRCEFCNFKSESALAMANHYETPHMNGIMYKCNFCTFEIRNATEIVYHMEAVHNIKARLIKPLSYHQCPNCGFEDNGKAKLARHQPVCAKKYRPELNLAPPNDWEAPAKIPRIKPRHGLVGTATAYQAMAAQAAAQKAAMLQIQQQQLQAQQQQQAAIQARTAQAAALAAQNAANKVRGRPPVAPLPKPSIIRGGANQARNVAISNVPPQMSSYPVGSPQFIQQQQQAANAIAKKTLCGQPSISVIPLPRQNTITNAPLPSTSKMPAAGINKTGSNAAGTSAAAAGPGNKSQFVICEICDGYIKDLEQLRNHMHKVHNVKIHPKMIYNRPPLNCQKCQFRFFTDQGLERHLLGSHGLVTSSMQEAANKGKDAGRCPVCGRYQWRLLSHVSRDHHMSLKPAHLSYKCTVCTATFGMYKEFETHVYTAHSTVAKKAMDAKKNTITTGAGSGGSGSGGGINLSNNANDSLLRPLKINDEITIIPQPAAKSRISQMETHIID